MSDKTYPPGTRLRVTFEGGVQADGEFYTERQDVGSYCFSPGRIATAVSIEVIAPPEPPVGSIAVWRRGPVDYPILTTRFATGWGTFKADRWDEVLRRHGAPDAVIPPEATS